MVDVSAAAMHGAMQSHLAELKQASEAISEGRDILYFGRLAQRARASLLKLGVPAEDIPPMPVAPAKAPPAAGAAAAGVEPGPAPAEPAPGSSGVPTTAAAVPAFDISGVPWTVLVAAATRIGFKTTGVKRSDLEQKLLVAMEAGEQFPEFDA